MSSGWRPAFGPAYGPAWGTIGFVPPVTPPVVVPVPEVLNVAAAEYQRRGLHPATAAALASEALAPIAMVEMHFSDWVRCWSGIGTLIWRGVPWYGTGTLGKIGAIEETTEVRATGVQLALSGLPLDLHVEDGRTLAEVVFGESWQGRAVSVYFAVLDDRRRFVGRPIRLFKGKMDQFSMKEETLLFTCESALFDLQRTMVRRWTAADQRGEYPDDAGCDAVASMQQIAIFWGTPKPN